MFLLIKKGDSQLPSNYRPISLVLFYLVLFLLIFWGKVLEKLFVNRCWAYLARNNILAKYQHGFNGKNSTVTNLIECFNIWTDTYSN